MPWPPNVIGSSHHGATPAVPGRAADRPDRIRRLWLTRAPLLARGRMNVQRAERADDRSTNRFRSIPGPNGPLARPPRHDSAHVLVLGGFPDRATDVRAFVERLRARVRPASWSPTSGRRNWLISSAPRGPGAIATRSGKALLEAARLAAQVSDGAPVLVVGHRPAGFDRAAAHRGRAYCRGRDSGRRNGSERSRPWALRTSCRRRGDRKHLNMTMSAIAEEAAPGAFHSPKIGYVAGGRRGPFEAILLRHRSVSGSRYLLLARFLAALPSLDGGRWPGPGRLGHALRRAPDRPSYRTPVSIRP